MSDAIERYLVQVDRGLPGGRRVRADVIDELRDGLLTAVEDQPACRDLSDRDNRIDRVITAFGDPADLAVMLGREIRLRTARRGALQLAALFFVMGFAWQLYDAHVGTPETMVPEGWLRPLFLTGTVLIKFAPTAAQLSALLFAAATSLRWASPYTPSLLRPLAATTLVATSSFGLSSLLIMATVAPGHRLETAVIGLPLACLLAIFAMIAHRIAQYEPHARSYTRR